MTDFDPGEGWREVPVGGVQRPYVAYYPDSETGRYWVREEPVPPLPTEPYTVIRVTWAPGHRVARAEYLLDQYGEWSYDSYKFSPQWLAKHITGFEVLAEPRAVTAKAVLDRAAEMGLADNEIVNYYLPREFKVES